MKKLLGLGGVLSLIIVATELLGLGLLWYQGKIHSDTWEQVQDVLNGGNTTIAEDVEEKETLLPSQDDVLKERSLRILELSQRKTVLTTLKNLLSRQAEKLVTEQEQLDADKAAFEKRSEKLEKELNGEATAQAQRIIEVMKAADAVKNLMELDLDESVRLVKGLQDETIARILQEFLKGTPELQERGQKIFEAISVGEPKKTVIDETRQGVKKEVNAPTG